jgi:hypothetical protein
MTTETKTRTTWDIYESPNKGAEETTALFEWSRNFDAGKTPATLFLGLIGWEDMDHLVQGVALGYMELDYLGDALKEYANNPLGVRDAITELLEAEMSE